MRHRPTPATVLSLLALVLAAGGFAVAAIPAADGTIHACYDTVGGSRSPGTVRIVDEAASCEAGEQKITWNQKGQPGATGATGPTGPAGPQGPAGEDGTAGTLLKTAFPNNGSVTIKVSSTGVAKDLELPEGRWLVLANGDVHAGVYDSSNKYGRVSCKLNAVAHDAFSTPTQMDSTELRFPKIVNSNRKQGQHLSMAGLLVVGAVGAEARLGCSTIDTAITAKAVGMRIYAVRVAG